MKEVRFGTLGGLELPVLVYESISEAVIAAGGNPNDTYPPMNDASQRVLDELNSNLAYRGVLNLGREIICELLEEKTGVERKMKGTGKKDKDQNEIMVPDESEGKYASRVMATQGWEDLKQFQPDLDSIARNYKGEGEETAAPLAVDIKQRERKSAGPKKLADAYKLTAAKIITNGTIDKANRQLANINKTFTPTNDQTKLYKKEYVDDKTGEKKTVEVSDADAETLGWMLKEFAAWQQAQTMAAMA